MMKGITFFIGGLRGGGAEKVCVNLANGLAARGYSVEVVVLSLRGDVCSRDLSPNVKLTVLGVNNVRSSLPACCGFLLKRKPGVILSFNRQLSIVLVCVRALLRQKFRLVSRNIVFLSEAQKHKKGLWHGFIVGTLVRAIYPKSDFFVAQSAEMKGDLVDFLGVPEDKIAVIHNPINSAIENPGSLRIENTKVKDDYILSVGRLEAQKNQESLLRVFALVTKSHPRLRLKIVGQGSLRAELEKTAEELGIAALVDFEGFKSNVVPYFVRARMTVLTSRFEGFPNVLVESIAVGTPVVSYDCPSGPKEIVEPGINGYLVPAGNEEACACSILKALARPWDHARIIHTSKRFGLQSTLDKYLAVLFP